MANIRDRILSGNFANNSTTPMVNAMEGGQNGPSLNLGKYVNNAAYVKRNVIARVVEFPRWVEYMEEPAIWRKAIKTFFEVHTQISGLNKGLQAEFTEQQLGSTNHVQYDLARVTEEQSEVTHSTPDKYGKVYQHLFSTWLRYGMQDPETRLPLISVINDTVPDLLPDMYSATVLYFEPDPTHRHIQDAYLITNMAPRSNGPDEARKDLSAGGELNELAIAFTGLQQTNLGVKQFAKEVLDTMNLGSMNPDTRKAFISEVSADALATPGGYIEQANAMQD